MSQVRMIYGEFIYASGMDNNTNTEQIVVYWVFAGTFLVVMYFILVNFFLAIVVDGFVKVKSDMEKNPSRYVLMDMLDVPFSNVIYWYHAFPRRHDIFMLIKEYEQECEEKKTLIEVLKGHDVAEFVPIEVLQRPPKENWPLHDEDKLCAFLYHYFCKCPRILATNEEEKKEEAKRQTEATPATTPASGASETRGMKNRLEELQELKDCDLVTTEEFMRLQASIVKSACTEIAPMPSGVGGILSEIQIDPKRTIDKE